jgi:hypothetical protein
MSIAGNLSFLENAAGQVIVTNTTPSNSSATGALTVAGGVGIAGGLVVNGVITATNLTVNGIVTASNIYVGTYPVSTATALTTQYFGTNLGTAGTLNFATGTTATLVGGVLTIQATASGGGTTLPSQSGQGGKYLTTDGSNLSWGTVSGGGGGATLSGTTSTIVWSIDGSGYVPPTGDKTTVVVPYDCYITQATVIGNSTGSALIYVSTSTVSSWPSRTLISSSTITLSYAQTLQISTGSWTNTVLTRGQLIVASLQTVSTFTFLTLSLSVVRT